MFTKISSHLFSKPFLLLALVISLSACSSEKLLARRVSPRFDEAIKHSNKTVLILEPKVTAHKINDPNKEYYEASSYLQGITKGALTSILDKRGYKSIHVADARKSHPEIEPLLSIVRGGIHSYIYDTYNNGSLLPEAEAYNLHRNLGTEAVELGRILETDQIIFFDYKSTFLTNYSDYGLLWHAIDSVAKSGVTRHEEFKFLFVLVDAKTGDIIYSNNLYDIRKPIITVLESDLFKAEYYDQIFNLMDIAFP